MCSPLASTAGECRGVTTQLSVSMLNAFILFQISSSFARHRGGGGGCEHCAATQQYGKLLSSTHRAGAHESGAGDVLSSCL